MTGTNNFQFLPHCLRILKYFHTFAEKILLMKDFYDKHFLSFYLRNITGAPERLRHVCHSFKQSNLIEHIDEKKKDN
jgi:hypothetical protein